MRRLITLLTTIPLMMAGSIAAHQTAYWSVSTSASDRRVLLAATGHEYLTSEALPAYASIGLTLLIISVIALLRGVQGKPMPVWPLMIAAPLAFTVQEHAERLAHGGTSQAMGTIFEQTFLPGLLLQLPFMLIAWAVARAIMRGAHELGDVVRRLAATRAPHAPRRARKSQPCSAYRFLQNANARPSRIATFDAMRAPPCWA